MRIGVVCHNYLPHIGGVEIVASELAQRLAVAHEVIVVSTGWDGRAGVSREGDVTVHRLHAVHATEKAGVPYPVPVGPGISRAFAALKTCDVIHVHGCLYATTMLAVAALQRRTPLVITEHVGFVRYQSAVVNTVERLAWAVIGDRVVRRSARLIALNSVVRDWLSARFDLPVTVIPNGVDSDTFRPQSSERRTVARDHLGLPQGDVLGLFVGRAAQKKNLDAVLNMKASGYRLVLCGALRDSVPPGVLDLGIVRHADMPTVFAACDFMIHAATGEGFPLAVQEAMASALPVVLLWDQGYAAAVDRDAVVAVNSLDELSAAVARLAADRASRQELGERARAFVVNTWSWDLAVRRYLEIFHSSVDALRASTT